MKSKFTNKSKDKQMDGNEAKHIKGKSLNLNWHHGITGNNCQLQDTAERFFLQLTIRYGNVLKQLTDKA